MVRFEGARYNWSDVIERLTQPAPDADPPKAPADEPAAPARFSVNNIQITGGQIDFDDRPADLVHRVRELALGIPFISGFPAEVERFVEPALSAHINDTVFSLDGRTRPFGEALETVFDIVFDPFDVAPYLAYLPFEPAFKLESGQLATKLELAFSSLDAGPQLTLAGTVTASEIDLNGHVNHVRYLSWALDSVAPDWLASHRLRRLQIQFRSEARLGDPVTVSYAAGDDSPLTLVHAIRDAAGQIIAQASTDWLPLKQAVR